MKRTKQPLTKLLVAAGLLLAFSVVFAGEGGKLHTVRLPDAPSLQFYLRWTPDREPLISAHRGGPEPGYPENCIASFENAIRYSPCVIELDVRKSLDGELVLMHDWTLDRTTTASGPIEALTLDSLKTLQLIAENADTTEYVIPTFSEALTWARGKAILTVDVKRPVTPEEIVAAIEAHEAESYAVVITYNADEAFVYHNLNPNLVLSVGISSEEDLNRLVNGGVPTKNMIAFVGITEPDKPLYELLHSRGIRCILGVMGNLDQRAEARGNRIYRDLYKNGADVLSTDRVASVAKAIEELKTESKQKTTQPKSKKKTRKK